MSLGRLKSKKSAALLASVFLLLVSGVGGTAAFLMDSDDSIKNTFLPSEITTTVDEDISGTGIKKDVRIKNTGDLEAYIRAKVIVSWQDKDGNVYGKKPVLEKDYLMELNIKSSENSDAEWILSDDGYYYYVKPVSGLVKDENGEPVYSSTDVLIKKCEVLQGAPDSGYFLTVEVIGSGIQSLPASVVTTEWSSGVSGVDGTTLQIKQ